MKTDLPTYKNRFNTEHIQMDMHMDKQREMNEGEERFYEFLVNNFGTSLKSIMTQCRIDVNGFSNYRIIDFILTLPNDEKIYIETDGKIHKRVDVAINDFLKEDDLKKKNIHVLRINFTDFFRNQDLIADIIDGRIDLLRGA